MTALEQAAIVVALLIGNSFFLVSVLGPAMVATCQRGGQGPVR